MRSLTTLPRGQIIEQSDICQGVVKDANGESIIGASVLVKGTTNGSITGLDGDFSLRNVKKGDIIVVSYVGYQSQEIAWTGEPLNIVLKEDAEVLDEVVVIGYGAVRKAGYGRFRSRAGTTKISRTSL